jgi:hypothetical protein
MLRTFLVFSVAAALSSFAFSQDIGATPKTAVDAVHLDLHSQSLDLASRTSSPQSMLGHGEVHVLDLQGTGISQVPEPSPMAFFGLLATPFLFRRRRPRLN